MQTISYDRVVDAINMAEIPYDTDPDEIIRRDYSGRGMYGDECFGIVCDIQDLLLFVVALTTQGDPDDDEFEWTVMELVKKARSDGMGLSTIWYFPGWQLEGGDEG